MKLGMIGSGFISKFQALALREVRGWEIRGLLNRGGSEALADFIRRNNLGPGTIYDDIASMSRDVDVLAIYSPNHTRVPVMEEIVESVEQGSQLKGLICEKPLGRNLKEARQLLDLANHIKVPTAYFENQLFMKPLVVQREQLKIVQETMGPLSLVRSSEEHAGPHEAWFWDPIRQGGGVLSDMGCHSIAVGWYSLIPAGRPIDYLEPISVNAEVGLLKWGRPEWMKRLREERDINYQDCPAEDFATGIITYRDPESKVQSKAQFTNSWMFEKQGLRILVDGMGPGYAFEVNTLMSPLSVFIGDEAGQAVADSEQALEKSTSSRGLLTVQYNEADLYGYTDENRDALEAFSEGRDGKLPWSYGLEITRLVMASYLSAETGKTIDLTDDSVNKTLEDYVPAIARGEGGNVLL